MYRLDGNTGSPRVDILFYSTWGVCALVGISGFFFAFFFFPPLYCYFSCFLPSILLRSAEAGSNKFSSVKLCWLIGFGGVLFLF